MPPNYLSRLNIWVKRNGTTFTFISGIVGGVISTLVALFSPISYTKEVSDYVSPSGQRELKINCDGNDEATSSKFLFSRVNKNNAAAYVSDQEAIDWRGRSVGYKTIVFNGAGIQNPQAIFTFQITCKHTFYDWIGFR